MYFRIVAVMIGLVFTIPAIAQTITVGNVETGPGERASGWIEVPGADDEGAEIPVTVINGQQPGHTLALIAGIHGYEYAPMLALQRVRKEIDPADLHGAIIMVHVANPASFFGRTVYYNPIDGMNLNRAFPGDPNGSHSERVAYALTSQVIEQADYLVDLHAGDGNEALRPFTYLPRTGNGSIDRESQRLALAFGLDHILIDNTGAIDPATSRFVDYTAVSRGVPAVTTETGQLGSTEDSWVAMAVDGIHGVLAELSLLGSPVAERPAVTWLEGSEVLPSPADGFFRALVRDGYYIADGGKLGVLTNEFGDEIAVIRAPFAGVVNYVLGTPPVRTGEPLAMVSRIADRDQGR